MKRCTEGWQKQKTKWNLNKMTIQNNMQNYTHEACPTPKASTDNETENLDPSYPHPEWTQNGSELIGKGQKISKMASKT